MRRLCKNEYSIDDTLELPNMLSSVPPLPDNEEDVLYDVQSLSINIPIEQTISCITKQIYIQKNLMPIYLSEDYRPNLLQYVLLNLIIDLLHK